MPSQTKTLPATVINMTGIGADAWSNPGNAQASDDAYARVTLGSGGISNYLVAKDWGFSIPDGAAIDGIVVTVERSATNASRISDYRIRAVKDGTVTGSDQSAAGFWGTTDTIASYGSEADLWGETWNPIDINSANFGVAIAASRSVILGSTTAQVDHVTVTVYYTPGPVVVGPDLPGWELHLRHYGRDGVLKNGFVVPLTARYTNSLDADEPLVLTLNALTYAALDATIEEYDLMEVMIRNRFLGVASATGGFVRDFVGIVRGSAPDRFTDDDGQTYLTWFAPEQKHVFAYRRVAWPAGVANRSTFSAVSAETAVKTLVEYNCTGSASVGNGRHRAGSLANMGIILDIEADAAGGGNVSLSFAGGDLLASLARICELGGDYYVIEWQGGSLDGDHEFALTWGRGSDKSSGGDRVLFSLANNTMRNPRRRYSRALGTVAIAAGQGQGNDRAISIVSGDDYAADNDIELWVDARNAETSGGREGQAAAKLDEAAEESELLFDVLLTSDVFYSPVAVTGRATYHVGDRVLASYGGEETRRIRRAIVTWEHGGAADNFQVSIESELWT